MKTPKAIFYLVLLIMTSCAQTKEEQIVVYSYVEEPHSYAKPNNAFIKHLKLDITVDFETEIISGKATYDIENNNSTQIILDSKYLEIESVTANGKETDFSLGVNDKQLGQPLTITIEKNTKQIEITYKTTKDTEALQWLKPQQTADKTNPFLFTQGQAILTRTWIPIQDSPQIRISYEANVQVPKGLMAVMSAENPKEKNESGLYHFQMEQAIPAYLIALAVGDFEYKAISERTGVYAEKSMLNKVQEEFSDMEKMVSAAEDLYGPYAWEQFDVIVLPPSFPFGGMENPRLTFATPTVIAGDKSLTSLVAHELAHSWSGNLVTNATWNDFWLNEGFTVYFEMRIMEALYGKERADMLALMSRQDLDDELENLKETPNDTKLKLDLKGKNPDDGMNSIAYDKGYLFLRTLEEAVGREKFDAFLKQYFKEHAFSSMTTEKFVTYLNTNLLEKNKVTFNTEEWINQPGVPKNQAVISSDKFKNVELTLQDFILTGKIDKETTKDWTSQEWVHFIRNFPKTMTADQMKDLDTALNLTNSTNSYIQMVWYEQALNHDYHGKNIDSKIEDFLISVGRRWYVETIFKAFKRNNRMEEALKIYEKSRPNYHSVTAKTIDDLLGFEPTKEVE
ncbi:aminopeptidase N [Gelidibacter algens]|uniref:Aminopeptidase N n=1 Tax=Gelidibacter algens TaxID=49280 RepID=A0A1A7R5W1_9FLAO|nr:M1 family metallopeptidase [Gelidibacter algens]OBX26864.1 aminopeptidase [Gelidibacter algens]RAJ19940.1 aminopeptidase N [Gelidibacter algens]